VDPVGAHHAFDELILPARIESVGRARHQILSMAAELGIDGAGDLELITSELTSNAVKDSTHEIRLRLSRGDAVLRLEVDDDGPGLPRLIDGTDAGGWGLRLVDEVSTAWGVIPMPNGGKTVWAEVPAEVLGEVPTHRRPSDVREPKQMAPEWFRDALDAMLDLVGLLRAVRDEDGKIVDFQVLYSNPARTEALVPANGNPKGVLLRDLHPGPGIGPMIEVFAGVVESGESTLVEEVGAATTIADRRIEGTYTIAVSKFGDGVLAVARDVTQQRAARQHLEDVNRKFEAAQELAHIGIWGIDFATGMITVSDELARIFGYPHGGEVDWHQGMVFEAVHPDDRARVRDVVERAAIGDGILSTEARVVRPDGDERQVAVHARISFDEEGAPTGVWGTGQDVTAQRAAEHALEETTSELAREQTMVDQLQRAILPRLPERPGLEVAARYLPAGSGARVGGDWYDVFPVGDDDLAFSIGDVAGHGLDAASLMAQLRNALRGAAYCGASPIEALAAIDRLVSDHAGDEFATCIFGVLHLAAHRVEWANAGHPPLLLVPEGGAPGYLETADQPPLGVGADRGKIHEREIGPGSLLLAYTDGLIEQPDENLDIGLARLRDLVDQHRGEALDELCENIGMSMFEQRVRRDDVCVLALRTNA
jgi:PAS domain S-box-containing protein